MNVSTRGVIITANGGRAEVCDIGLGAMQRIVNGYVEALDIVIAGKRCTMWRNQEGKLASLPRSPLASSLASRSGIVPGDYIAGDVLITGGTGPDGETLAIDDDAADALMTGSRLFSSS